MLEAPLHSCIEFEGWFSSAYYLCFPPPILKRCKVLCTIKPISANRASLSLLLTKAANRAYIERVANSQYLCIVFYTTTHLGWPAFVAMSLSTDDHCAPVVPMSDFIANGNEQRRAMNINNSNIITTIRYSVVHVR